MLLRSMHSYAQLQNSVASTWYVDRPNRTGRLEVIFDKGFDTKVPVKIYPWGGGSDTHRDALMLVGDDGLKFYHPLDDKFLFNDLVAAFEIDDEILRSGSLSKYARFTAHYPSSGTVLASTDISLSLAELILDNLTAWEALPMPKGSRLYLERDKATGLMWLYGLGRLLASTRPQPIRIVVWADNEIPTWTFSNDHVDLLVYDTADPEYDLFSNLSVHLNVLLQRLQS